jgi:hypothetical protein
MRVGTSHDGYVTWFWSDELKAIQRNGATHLKLLFLTTKVL